MAKLLKGATVQAISNAIQAKNSKIEAILNALTNRTRSSAYTDIDNLDNRLEVVENAITQILFSLEDLQQYPNYMNFIMENFNDTNQLDTSNIKITSITVSDDSVDVEDIGSLMPCSDYVITDGINSERVQIKSINKLNRLNRIILTEPVQYSYNINTVRMIRTNAILATGSASGSGKALNEVWAANFDWQGLDGSNPFTISAAPSASDSASYSLSDNMQITADGYFTLNDLRRDY